RLCAGVDVNGHGGLAVESQRKRATGPATERCHRRHLEMRVTCHGEIVGALEGSVASAEKHADVAVGTAGVDVSGPEVGHGEVGLAVAVEVCHRHRERLQASGVIDGWLE